MEKKFMKGNRDNFPPKVVETLKQRAAYICSNPTCKKMTVAPSLASEDDVIYMGRAAHICAASPGGPRYDANMPPEDRSSISNAIFLCANCADIVDDNGGKDFPVDILKKWKNDHNKWVSQNLNKSTGQASAVINIATSHNQTGGITANQVNIQARRDILPGTDQILLQEIKDLPKRRISVMALAMDSGGRFLAGKISVVLKKAGWTVTDSFYEAPGVEIKNVIFGITEVDQRAKEVLRVGNWLKHNFSKTTIELIKDSSDLIIFVGEES